MSDGGGAQRPGRGGPPAGGARPEGAHPRDGRITIYGRKPVLEALGAPEIAVEKVLLAKSARGGIVQQIAAAARRRGVDVVRTDASRVSRVSRRPKQDQGVVADVSAPGLRPVESWLADHPEGARRLLALDGVTTPANVGMILRTATVLGLDGVLLPRRGVPDVGPLVIKASAGYAFRASVLRCAELDDGLSALKMSGFCVYGLADDGAEDLSGLAPRERSIFVLGNETEGLSERTRPLVDAWVRIPMARAGDSLNVAVAAAIVANAARI